jgi:hypothetical protein
MQNPSVTVHRGAILRKIEPASGLPELAQAWTSHASCSCPSACVDTRARHEAKRSNLEDGVSTIQDNFSLRFFFSFTREVFEVRYFLLNMRPSA